MFNLLKNTQTPTLFAIPFLLVIAFVGIPILLSPMDFWDGRILYHSFETHQYLAVDDWFKSSGWHLQLAIVRSMHLPASLFSALGTSLLRTISLISLLGLIYESYKFARYCIFLNHFESLFVAVIVACFPAWSTLLSSVLFIYILCTWLVFLSMRLILTSCSYINIAMGYLFLLLSFQLNSNFLFSVAIPPVFLVNYYFNNGFLPSKLISRFYPPIFLSIICFFSLRSFFKPSGLYSNYNSINLGFLSNPANLLYGYSHYMSFTIVGLVTISFVAICLRIKNILNQDAPTLNSKSINLLPLYTGLFLLFFATFPYVAVAKYTNIKALDEWSYRHVFLSALPCALIFVGYSRYITSVLNLPKTSKFLCITAVVTLFACIQLSSTWIKLSRSAYEAGIIESLKAIPPPPSGIVVLVPPHQLKPSMRYYESNWLFYKAYGLENWFVYIPPDQTMQPVLPDWMGDNRTQSKLYHSKYIMNNFIHACNTKIAINGPRLSQLSTLRWIIYRTPPLGFTAKMVSNYC